MPDDHEVRRLRLEAFDPGRRVIVGSQSIGLVDVGVHQSAPDLRRLASPSLAGVNNPTRSHAEHLDCVGCHTLNVVDTLVGQRPFGVAVLGRGLPMLNEIELHGRDGRRALALRADTCKRSIVRSMSEAPTTPPPPAAGPTPAAPSGQVGKPRSIGWTIVLSIVTFGIWTFFWSWWNGNELKAYRPAGVGGVGYLILTIFIAPVTMFLMAYEVEQLYREDSQQPQITTLWGLWFLLPLIGHIIWYVRIQSAINEFWVGKGAAPSTSPTG